MSIELMTGDNQNFVHLSWVAHDLDGTTGDGAYTWTCPTVDPPAPIYFYRESAGTTLWLAFTVYRDRTRLRCFWLSGTFIEARD